MPVVLPREPKDEELYTRWLQMSCFSPILRPHGSGIPSEPVYFSEQTQDIVRHFMQVRYSLIPYIYTTAAQSKMRGYPITRPVFFDFPDDTITYSLGNQYLFGDQILVAPIIQKGQAEINVYLPDKVWYSFWNDQMYIGKNWYALATHMETIPVFVKEGSFIPMVKPVSSTDNYSSKALTIRYYPSRIGDSSFFNMFEDDGKTYGTIGRGEFELLRFSAFVDSGKELMIKMIRDGWEYDGMPKNREIKLEIVNQLKDSKYDITINGEKIKKKKKKDVTGYSFGENNRLIIEFPWNGKLTQINIFEK